MNIHIITLLLWAVSSVYSWNTCADESFCSKIRAKENGNSSFVLDLDTFAATQSYIKVALINSEDKKLYNLSITALSGGVFRIIIDDPVKPRHSAFEALDGEPKTELIEVNQDEEGNISLGNGETTIEIRPSPFKLEVYKSRDLILVINKQGKLTFNSGNDESIALDFSFPGAERAYGIPEHAERLSLKTTTDTPNPYRLFNLDYCCYPLETKEALYGSVPVLYAHGTSRTSGLFWLNSAQTFVDINNEDNQVDTLFISESGVIDFFILPGPTLADSVKQYTNLTGPAPLPQYFAIAYHQSRWSYMSQEEAVTVVKEFDNHDLPLDVIWLDIDYTDSYKYFTWNYESFPDPDAMQEYFKGFGRKLVVIVDPHYKVEEGYFVYDTAKANDYFVKYSNGTDFEGECWPGISSYIDFTNPDAADWYSSLYGMESFPNGSDILHVWNDMNEPSVFDTDEKTMPRNLVHHKGWLHRDVHNMYGFSQTAATHKGLLDRYDNQKRPFVLTRSHFAGSQRYTAVWTGDNVASWEHLRISFPMCLTEALAGISFCGADVGGFVEEVGDELYQRWYQAGAWLPFFRAHTSIDNKRREPYLYPEDVQERFRNAIRQRYFHLPYWYTIWYEHERYGDPVIRPISYHYSNDPNTLDIDDEWLVGADVLVHPVTEEGASQVNVYLPGGSNQTWFDATYNVLYRGIGYVSVNVSLDFIPVFYRGGSIIARKDTPRPSSVYTYWDPYFLYLYLDDNRYALGTLFEDDFETFNYRDKKYSYFKTEFVNDLLEITLIDGEVFYDRPIRLGTIKVYRPPAGIKEVVAKSSKTATHAKATYGPGDSYLIIEDLNVVLDENLKIEFLKE